jgi:predicted translin family RNA/ssDNA-binding protein
MAQMQQDMEAAQRDLQEAQSTIQTLQDQLYELEEVGRFFCGNFKCAKNQNI